MTRQKQVFPRDTVAHLWAHKAQDAARDPSGNFYFTGPTIYSYGSHFAIAHILSDECGPEFAGRVLWNDATYSNTTSKMQSIVWQALTRQQRENALHMPESIGMGRNTDPHRIERALIEKRLPDVAPLLIARVIECVSELPKKRYGSGPFENLLHEARKAESLALLFYARAKRKYPLALIDTRPVSSDKAQWVEWVKTIAIGKMKTDYAEALKNAKHYAEQARENAAQCTDGFPYFDHRPGQEWEARNVVNGAYDAAQKAMRYVTDAKRLFALLNGTAKRAPVLAKLEKELQPIAALFLERRAEFERAETRNRVIRDIRETAKMLRRLSMKKQRALLNSRRQYSDMESLLARANESGLTDETYLGLAARYSRIGVAMSARDTLKRASEALDVAQSYMPAWPADAIRHAIDTAGKIQFIGRLDIATGMRGSMHAEMTRIDVAALVIRESAHAAIMEKNAETLRAWLACESNARPAYEAGTYARINGEMIETTRGATVPIEHACRLSRMYAIAVRKGGAEWRDGAGPIVGHYRVNKIGADGSLIIGCHEFSADEAKRLHGLLESCEACATVTA